MAFGIDCSYEEVRAHVEERQRRYVEALPPPREAPALVQWLLAGARLLLATCGAWVAAGAWGRLDGEGTRATADVAELWAGAAAAAAAALWQAREWAARALGWTALDTRLAAHAESVRWMEAALLPPAVRNVLPLVAEGLASSVAGLGGCRVQTLPFVAVDLLDDATVSLEVFVTLSHPDVDGRRHHSYLRLLNSRHGDALEEEMRRRAQREGDGGGLAAMLWSSAAAVVREAVERVQLLHGQFLGLEDEWDAVHLLLVPSPKPGEELTKTLVYVQSAAASLVNPHDVDDRVVFTSVQQGSPHPMLLGTRPAAVLDPEAAPHQQVDDTLRQFLLRAKYGPRMGI